MYLLNSKLSFVSILLFLGHSCRSYDFIPRMEFHETKKSLQSFVVLKPTKMRHFWISFYSPNPLSEVVLLFTEIHEFHGFK